MRIPIGIVCSVLGATTAFYLAIITLVTLPSDGSLRWFAIAGITALSFIAGILINGISMQDFNKVSRAYGSLTSRLSPLLYSGIEDVLHRQKKMLESGGDLNFLVSAPISGYLRVVGATYLAGDPIRQHDAKFGEGTRGFLADHKVAGYARTSGLGQPKVEGNRPVFDRVGGLLGEIPPLSEASRWKTHAGEKWLYGRPIFEKSTESPWSNRLVGILTVHSSADDADSFFKTEEFQHLVNSIASEVSPYLDAIQVLVAEQKL
jgi:hypothetical protein